MEWSDEGVLLAVRRHGERDAILDVFTRDRGRHAGLLRGGATSRRAAELQPGAQLTLRWRARLEEHLGVFQAEASKIRAGRILDDPLALAALSSVTALLCAGLAERDPQQALYAPTVALLDALGRDDWTGDYAAWELRLLETLGYGLDLSACAVTGSTQELIWVSPRSGRAVSRSAGAPYADKLLPLPSFLRLGGPAEPSDFADALRLTGRFLDRRVAPALGWPATPRARDRLAALANKAAVQSR